MTAPRRPNSGFVPDRLLGHLVGGAFKLLRVVGTGGTATVFEAQELGTARRCAVKVLHPNPADVSAGPRFIREGEIAQRLMGPHAVEIIRAGQVEGGQPFLVMEFLEGEDLAARLEQRGRLPSSEVVDFVRACAEVLERAHSAGIIHRDLKPANVFYARRSSGEEIKLLDFGAAKDNQRDDKLTAAGQVVGTPWYMSPEQARGQALDARSDEFSLAIIAFQALGGRVPFDAPRPTDVLFKIVSEPLPPLQDLPADLRAAAEPVLQKALAKKASERFANVKELAQTLEAALGPWVSHSKPSISVNLGEAPPSSRVETADEELAMVLSAHNLVTEVELRQALEVARKDGGDLADALLRLGIVPEAQLLSVMPMPAHWRPAPSERVRMTLPPEGVLGMVGVELATRLRVLPFGWTPIKGELRVFVAFPAVPNLELELKKATKAQKVAVYVTSPGAVHAAIRRWYYQDPTAFTELLPNGAGPRSPVPPKAGSAPSASPTLSGESVERAPSPPAAPPPAPPVRSTPSGPQARPTSASGQPQASAPSAAAPVATASLPPATVPTLPVPPPAAPPVASEWKPPSIPHPSKAPKAAVLNPTTGEFEMLPAEREWIPAGLRSTPPEEPSAAAEAEVPDETSLAVAPAAGPQSAALGAATAAYPVVNDRPVIPDLAIPPSATPTATEAESLALSAATAAYPSVVVTDAPEAPPLPEPSPSLVGLTGSFSIVVEEEGLSSLAPPVGEPGLPAGELQSPPRNPSDEPIPEGDDFSLEVSVEAEANRSVEPEGGPRPRPATPPPPPQDRAEPRLEEGPAKVATSDGSPPQLPPPGAEPPEAFAVEIEESVSNVPSGGSLVEPGVSGVRITSDVRAPSPETPVPAVANEAPSDVPVARRPTQQNVPRLETEPESREVELGELLSLGVATAESVASDSESDEVDPDVVAQEVAEARRGLAAPELVRQALGRVAEVAGADRVVLALVGGDSWTEPGSVPPLFQPGWLEALASEAGRLTLLPGEASLVGIPWFEGATTAAALSLDLPGVGRGAVVMSARQRPTPFSSGDLPMLSALLRQLGRVFSVAQTPARDRLDLEAWLAGERHLGSMADRGSQEGLEVRSRDAVVLCVDARPLLGSMSELGAVSVLERMNQLVEEIASTVYAHGGLLERVQGDGVVAVWGALADVQDEWALEALRVAEVLRTSPRFNGGPPGSGFRVGLHAGRVSVGPVGLRGRKSLSLVGVASALGFRLGSLGEGCPVASDEVLKRAGWMGPQGLDPRAHRVDSAGLGVEAFVLDPTRTAGE